MLQRCAKLTNFNVIKKILILLSFCPINWNTLEYDTMKFWHKWNYLLFQPLFKSKELFDLIFLSKMSRMWWFHALHRDRLVYYILAALSPRCGITVASLLLAAIGSKLIGPHGGLQVDKCRHSTHRLAALSNSRLWRIYITSSASLSILLLAAIGAKLVGRSPR